MRQAISLGMVGLVGVALTAGSARAYETENIRTIIPKSVADKACPFGAASYVPAAFQGRKGVDICAADANGWKACVGVKGFIVTADNNYGRYQPNDTSCTEQLMYPWPWGVSMSTPTTLGGEWSHGNTWVVCCY